MSEGAVGAYSPAGGTGRQGSNVVGGIKPLHRFLRGEPKCVGVAMVILGGSMIVFGIPVNMAQSLIHSDMKGCIWMGILFLICGSLYIVTEFNPTKKTVTACLAASIISIIGVPVAITEFSTSISRTLMDYSHVNETNSPWFSIHQDQLLRMEIVYLCHSVAGLVILLTMTILARLALVSSKTQAVVVMQELAASESAQL